MKACDLIIGFIKGFVFVWDLVTVHIYTLVQAPHKKLERKDVSRSNIISQNENEITIRAKPLPCPLKDELKNQTEKINTMEKLLKYNVLKFGGKRMLGTRAVLREEEEIVDKKPFIKRHMGDYSWLSYTQVDERADHLGRGLRGLGLNPRDKVVIYANTCADWMITAMACFKHSIAIVTIYTNLGEEGVTHGIGQTDARLVVVSSDLLPRLLSVLPATPLVEAVVVIPVVPSHTKPSQEKVEFHLIDEVVSAGRASSVVAVAPQPEDTAIIMYTSGSTGVPKGVVLTHGNVVQGVYNVLPTIMEVLSPLQPEETFIAYLPLAHVYEFNTEAMFITMGVPIGYSHPNTLLDTSTMVARGNQGDATVLRPTVMTAVPLVLDRVYKGIKEKIRLKGEFTERLIDFCYKYKLDWTRRGYDTPIMNRLVLSKFSAVLGGRVRGIMSGGAPLAPDAHDFCRTCLGITLIQGYGLTETTATASITDVYDLSTGSVGPPLQEVDIKLVNWEEGGYTVSDRDGPRGEIVIGGLNVAKEYYKMPNKTDEEFFTENGKRWFRTGDIGHYSPLGTLRIIDRKKDLVKLQHGEYVSLGKIESLLKIHPLVENICIYADPQRSHAVALVVPDSLQLNRLAVKAKVESFPKLNTLEEVDTVYGETGGEVEEMCEDLAVVEEVLSQLTRHCQEQKLSRQEIPRAVHLVSDPWTPESGLVTSSMKLRRKNIEHAFRDVIQGLYVD